MHCVVAEIDEFNGFTEYPKSEVAAEALSQDRGGMYVVAIQAVSETTRKENLIRFSFHV